MCFRKEELVAYSKNNVKHDVCGKIVIAVNKEEEKVTKFVEIGKKNGLDNLKIIKKKEILEIEPYAEVCLQFGFLKQNN